MLASYSTHEDLSIDVSISYYCRTDVDEARGISFLGVRTERQDFRILIRKYEGTQKISTQSSKLRVSYQYLIQYIYMHPRMTGMHNNPNNHFDNDTM